MWIATRRKAQSAMEKLFLFLFQIEVYKTMCVWIGMRPLGPSTLSPWHGLNGGIELGPSLSLNLACPPLSLSPLIFLSVLKSPLSLRKSPMVVAGLEHTQTYINMELSPPSTIILLPLTLFPHKSIPIPKPNWNPNICKLKLNEIFSCKTLMDMGILFNKANARSW